MTLEREVKLGVWPGFTLPELGGVAPGARLERLPDQHLDATYHDTTDLRLARRGITLRYRAGDDDGGGWTLKLPAGAAGGLLTRDEIVVAGDPAAVPDDIRAHLVAWVRTAPLVPVARLQTWRTRALVLGETGERLAEVVDDEVSVLDDRHVALRFREVEVELGADAGEAVLDEIVVRLRAAGAGAPDPTPKVARALGPRALAPAELVVPALGRDASAAEVLRAGVTRAVLRVLERDAGLRLTDDPEAVHQARVGTRRLRSDLRTFAPVLDRSWSEPLRAELRWLADVLGAVRDADVLGERLERDAAAIDPADACHAPALFALVGAERDQARERLRDALVSERYVGLLDRLVDAALDPRVVADGTEGARALLPRLVAARWDALAKAVRRAGKEPADEVLHAIRIRAKRARYAADVAVPVIGKPAARFAAAVADVQEVLGEHQDACVRRAWLRGASGSLSPGAALVAGQLVAVATATADAQRRALPDAWARANDGRLRTWLSR